ncbi:MAG TPA: hypothetical protein VKY74_10460, partial [Chloroflexia bacterium]|nr:hypothetical protein [Chloroflexia bacterium]
MLNPPPGRRRWAGPLLVVVSAGVLAAVAVWRLLPAPASDGSGSLAGAAIARFDTAAPIEAAAPLHVAVSLDLRAPAGSGPRITPYVDLQLRDAAGHPAVFGAAAAPQLPLHVTGFATGWTADMSAPTVPGSYHVHLFVHMPGQADTEIDLPRPVLTVIPATASTGGLVYSRNGNLWRADATGQHTHQLTFYTGDGRAADPAWAPDGRRLAFVRTLPAAASQIPNTEIWGLAPDGSAPGVLVARRPDEDLATPAFAPNGALYFTSDRTVDPATGGTPTIDQLTAGQESWSIDRLDQPAAGGPRQPVVSAARMPNVSWDGRLLVYLGAPDAPAERERPPPPPLILA